MADAGVDGRTARWAGHREQRREAFVDAAIAVIDREGPGATVDRIGAELGLTRQAVYRQFSDRRDLDRAIAARAAALVVGELLPHLDGVADLDTAIADGLHAYLDFVREHLSLYRFVRSHDAEVAADSAVRHVKETVGGRVATLAEDVLVGLDLPPDLAGTFATGVVGLVDAVVGRWLDEPRGLSQEQLVQQLTTIIGGTVRAVTG